MGIDLRIIHLKLANRSHELSSGNISMRGGIELAAISMIGKGNRETKIQWSQRARGQIGGGQ